MAQAEVVGWSERVCLVTGANTGIGLETARGLAALGATVWMTSRDVAKGEAAVADVRGTAKHERVHLLRLDLASTASTRQAGEQFLSSTTRLDVLVNNAGLVLSERRLTEDGFEMTFGVNHLGHFLLTMLLLDRMKATATGPGAAQPGSVRIVNLSSDAHRQSSGLPWDDLRRDRGYSTISSYGDSKLANILFSRALAKRLEGTGITANAVHPGVVSTSFAADGDTGWFGKWLMPLARPFLLTPADGAATSLYVATDPSLDAVSGRYFAKRREAVPTKHALDDAAAEQLWGVSEQLLGLPAWGSRAGVS